MKAWRPALVILCLAACAPLPWQKPGASRAQTQDDMDSCRVQVRLIAPRGASAEAEDQALAKCMAMKGYGRRP
jgi:hypothetical protein